MAAFLTPSLAKAIDTTQPATTEDREQEQEENQAQNPAPPPEPPPSSSPSPPPPPPPPPQKVDLQRAVIASYYAGFHFGIDPAVVFGNAKTAFALSVRLEYGIDTGSVIIAPGAAFAAYFFDPNVYIGMPTAKLVLPIAWFVPFIEGGAGVGQVTQPSTTGLALLGAGGFMIHASPNVALGVEAGYETILGTDFGAILLGPVLAIAF